MKVFVSSTYEDLKSYRAAVRRAIERLGHQPIMMEDFVSSSKPPKKECLDRVRDADILVGIYANRYGFIPRGDNNSITEQEYRFAKDRGKDVFCFLSADWQSNQPDDKEPFGKFIARIQRNHTVTFFKTPEELVGLVIPVVAKVHDEHMGPWQKAAKEIDNDEKLDLINNLIGRNYRGELSDPALKSSAKLIASDFVDFTPSTSLEFIEASGNLLKGNFPIGDYVKKANQLSVESATKETRKQKVAGWFKRNIVMVILSILVGLIIGVSSYILNIFDVRSKYMTFQTANTIDVISWLINDKVEGKLKIDNFDNEETQQALFALNQAISLDEKGDKTNEYLDRLLRDIDHRISIFNNPPPELLQENLKILKEIDSAVPFDAKSLKARIALAITGCLEKDPSIDYDKLLNAYQGILESHSVYVDTILFRQKISNLIKLKEEFEFQKAKQASETLTIHELIKSWKTYAATKMEGSTERTYAENEIKRLTQIVDKNATIDNETDFITCKGVDRETRKPFGITDKFKPGSVWVWARINAPRSERVAIKWYTKAGEYASTSAQISTSQGFRIYFAKNYGNEQTGINEVRLYNSQNILIGRRVFRVE